MPTERSGIEDAFVGFDRRRARAIRNIVHDDHRLDPRRREQRLDGRVSRAFLARTARSVRFDQAERDSGENGERGRYIRNRAEIHPSILRQGSEMKSRRIHTELCGLSIVMFLNSYSSSTTTRLTVRVVPMLS